MVVWLTFICTDAIRSLKKDLCRCCRNCSKSPRLYPEPTQLTKKQTKPDTGAEANPGPADSTFALPQITHHSVGSGQMPMWDGQG